MGTSAIGITGVAVRSGLGDDLAVHWKTVYRGRTGHTLHPALGESFPRPLVASLLSEEQWRSAAAGAPETDPVFALSWRVGTEALVEAGLEPGATGLVAGTSNGCLHSRRAYRDAAGVPDRVRGALLARSAVDTFAPDLAAALGLDGPAVGVSTACASSTHGVGLALGWLWTGVVRRVLVVGADAVLPMVAAGFEALGVLGTQACAPFSEPVGMSLGEGAAAWVLEADPEPARALAWVRGFGSSADAVHPTAPDPSGRGAAQAMARALADAGLVPADIRLVSVQGTGTEANDAAETLALARIFEEPVPVTAGKGHLGHCQGAGGLLEASLVLAGYAAGALPPTANHTRSRRLSPPDVVTGPPRPAAPGPTLKLSAAFGGANAALVLDPTRPPPRVRATVPLYLGGTSHLRGSPGDPPRTPGPAGPLRLGPHHLCTRLLATAVAQALPPDHTEDWGLFSNAPGLQGGAGTAWQASVQRGAASGRSFSRLVRNAACGATALALRLRGPTTTLSAGPVGGLVALVHALGRLTTSPDLPGIVVGAADEVGPNTLDRHALGPGSGDPLVDAAAAVAVTPVPTDVAVAAWALAPGHDLAGALRGTTAQGPDSVWHLGVGAGDLGPALATAGLGEVSLRPWPATAGRAPATDGLALLVDAVQALRAGTCQRPLVLVRGPGTAVVALVLGRQG